MSQIRRVTAPGAPEPPAKRFSNCLVVDDIAYISGQVAQAADGGGTDVNGPNDYLQSLAIFTKIKALVEAAGGNLADVVKMTVFMTDIRRREQVWQARSEFFEGDLPTSTLVEVSKLADPAVTVEIEAIAHIGASRTLQ
jgi:enamine deaminase RidA (YjgF/YER057c/UK114 family)